MNSYIKNPSTPEDHLSNCQFQLDNVKGWLEMARDKRDEGGAADLVANAHIKAKCLAESAQLLVVALEEARAKESR